MLVAFRLSRGNYPDGEKHRGTEVSGNNVINFPGHEASAQKMDSPSPRLYNY